MSIQPYLFFDGRAEEAAAFYREALGAEVEMMMRFGEMPESDADGCAPPGPADKVMHMSLRIGDTTVMGSDGHCGSAPDFQGFALSIAAADAAEADRLFAALGNGGEVRMPLGETFFSPRFGMVADRFGVTWMVNVEA